MKATSLANKNVPTSPPGVKRQRGLVENSALINRDVLGVLIEFVPKRRFFFVAPVSKSWREAWGRRATLTSVVTTDTSVSQLRCIVECGVPSDRDDMSLVCARLGKLNLLEWVWGTSVRGAGGFALPLPPGGT